MSKEGSSEIEVGLELGDKVMIIGGIYDRTIGVLYGFRSDRILIQPIGVTDTVKRIPLTSERVPDPDLGIEEIKIIRKVVRPGFLAMVDMKAGYVAETFGPNSTPTGSFTVESLNEEEDSAVFKTDTGELIPIAFDYTGIPDGLPYEVIRIREPPAEESGEKREEEVKVVSDQEGQEEIIIRGEESDESEEEGKEGEEADEDEDDDDFELGEVVILPKQKTIAQIGSADRIIQDVFQRQDLLSQLIQVLPQADQRNPLVLQEIRRRVETFLHLRNKVVRYGKAGEPLGMQLPGVSTVSELLEKVNVPLSKKVVSMTKVLYPSHIPSKKDQEKPYDLVDKEIRIEYQSDIVTKAEIMQNEMDSENQMATIGLPAFYMNMEAYRNAIQTPYIIRNSGSGLSKDEEVFRQDMPNFESPSVNAPLAGSVHQGEPPLKQIPFSMVRLVKPRFGRLQKSDTPIQIIEAGESPSYTNTLLFPRYVLMPDDESENSVYHPHSLLREFGPIRSGFLAQDISLGMTNPELLLSKKIDKTSNKEVYTGLLKELGTPDEFPTANSILSFGSSGKISEHIELSTWLKDQDIFIYGHGDIYEKMSGYSLESIEFDVGQQEIISSKIKQTYAALRIFLSEQQEKNKVKLSNYSFKSQNVLPEDAEKILLKKVDSEPILHEYIEDIRNKLGNNLAEVGINWFSYLYTVYPDLLLAVLGEQAAITTQYRRIHLRSLHLNAIYNNYLLKELNANAGTPPIINKCRHVKALQNVYKVENDTKDDTRDALKMKKYIDLLEEYRGDTRDNWIWCRVCNEHLICQHELLSIQEYLRPKEKDVLHKELILHFSRDQFCGKFTCNTCGKAIMDLDFDTSVEFDDQGRPMMGRAVMEDKEFAELEKIQELLNGPTTHEEELHASLEEINEDIEAAFPNAELKLMYNSLKTILGKIGISVNINDYKTLVGYLSEYLITIPTRNAYLELKKSEGVAKPQDYDIYKAIRYVCAIACVVLVFIQTRIPDFTSYYTLLDCRSGFIGFPLESEENESGLECIAMVIGSIDDKEYPWNTSSLQKYKMHSKRKEVIKPFIKALLKDYFLQSTTFQGLLKKKREYVKDIQGTSLNVKRDSIAKSFRPIPYVITEEEAAKAPVIPASATSEQKSAAWILTAHSIAKQNSVSSTTAGLYPILSPGSFWEKQSLPALEPKMGFQSRNSSTIATSFIPTLTEELSGNVKEEDYYKLFMEVCYQGERRGYTHELGIGLTCLNCGLSFQENPRLPAVMDANPSVQRAEEDSARIKKQTFLQSKGVEITSETFLELLSEARKHTNIRAELRPRFPQNDTIIYKLQTMKSPPLDGWKDLLQVTYSAIQEISKGATHSQIATAAEPLISKIIEAESFISERMPKNIFDVMQRITQQLPHECMESLRTYIIIPFQRWIQKIDMYGSFKILGCYKLSKETQDDIKGYYEKSKRRVKGLGRHLHPLSDTVLDGLLLLKTKKFVNDMSYVVNNILPVLRSILTPGGTYMVEYIQRALIMGYIKTCMDPHSIPETDEELPNSVNMQTLYVAIAEAFDRYSTSNRIPSEEEIRTKLEERAEAEKQKFIGELDVMSAERRKLELTLKSLGMGKWAVGGSMTIRKYDAQRYEDERVERAQAGLADYTTLDEQAQMQDEHVEDVNDGYDHDQMQEDDY